METNREKIETFLNNFFDSCEGEDVVLNFVNYYSDIMAYSRTCEPIRQNHGLLLDLFERVTGLKVYYDNMRDFDFLNLR